MPSRGAGRQRPQASTRRALHVSARMHNARRQVYDGALACHTEHTVMRTLLLFALCIASAQAWAGDRLPLQTHRVDELAALRVGARTAIDDFPDGHGNRSRIEFRRVDVYAKDARIVAVGPDGEHELPRSPRIELIGYDASGQMRAQLGFDPGFHNVAGAGSSASGTFVISAEDTTDGKRLVVKTTQEALPPGVTPQVIPTDDGVYGGPSLSDAPLIALAAPTPDGILRAALVAVDVDHELLVNRFGGTGGANITAATNWIADLFTTMNVMYERDLNVTLQQGTTRFRTGATPYAITQDAAASDTDLLNFGTYWQNNEGAVQRDFTALLSGRLTGGFSASGRAWLDRYCVTTVASGGSYSVNKVFTNSGVPVDLSARIVGHELGHNFGAAHTHCTNATSGGYPASSNTIDKCSSGESMPGGACYSGATSCPATGPGAPHGTLMSYCNNISCGSDHQNVLQFHPTQITTMSALIASHTPACLSTSSDIIFQDGFD